MSDLAATLGVQPPTVTKMISRLAAQDYVERRASKPATAGRPWSSSPSADAAPSRASTRSGSGSRRTRVSGIDDKDRKKLRKLLRQIERNLGARANGDDHEFADDDEESQATA